MSTKEQLIMTTRLCHQCGESILFPWDAPATAVICIDCFEQLHFVDPNECDPYGEYLGRKEEREQEDDSETSAN